MPIVQLVWNADGDDKRVVICQAMMTLILLPYELITTFGGCKGAGALAQVAGELENSLVELAGEAAPAAAPAAEEGTELDEAAELEKQREAERQAQIQEEVIVQLGPPSKGKLKRLKREKFLAKVRARRQLKLDQQSNARTKPKLEAAVAPVRLVARLLGAKKKPTDGQLPLSTRAESPAHRIGAAVTPVLYVTRLLGTAKQGSAADGQRMASATLGSPTLGEPVRSSCSRESDKQVSALGQTPEWHGSSPPSYECTGDISSEAEMTLVRPIPAESAVELEDLRQGGVHQAHSSSDLDRLIDRIPRYNQDGPAPAPAPALACGGAPSWESRPATRESNRGDS